MTHRFLAWLLCLVCCLPGAARALPPDSAESVMQGLLARGDIALRRGDSISAIGYYHDAIQRAPRLAAGYAALGRAYLTLREPEHARETFLWGLRSTRGSEELALGLARSREALGNPPAALATLRDQLAAFGGSSSLLEELARLAEAAGALSEALAARRALLSRALADSDSSAELLRQARLRVAALALLLGPADRLSPTHCAERKDSALLRRLIGCP
jgi:predicted Zn-dependent protease